MNGKRGTVLWARMLAFVALMTLVGAGGGFFGVQLQAVSYTAEAYAVVYQMPAGLTEILSPDEANQIQSVYRAGAFQPAVVARVLHYFPGMTEAQLRQKVQLTIIAYTPFTRITVTDSDPRAATQLANTFSDAWTLTLAGAYETAFASMRTQLNDQVTQLTAQIATLDKQLATPSLAQAPNSPQAVSLEAELNAAVAQRNQLETQLASLTLARNQVLGNAYTAVRATLGAVQQTPNPAKTVAAGAAIGFALGLALVLVTLRLAVLRGGGPPVRAWNHTGSAEEWP